MKKNNINYYNKLEHFLAFLKRINYISNKESISNKEDCKFIEFDFRVKYFLIFDKNGLLLICSTFSDLAKLSIKVIDTLKLIVMKLNYLNIKNYETFYKYLKIYFLNDNFIYVCITSTKLNSCLIRLYLYFLNIVYLNLIGDNVKNSNCLINISKIFEVYFVPSLTSKFRKVMEYILSNKETNSCRFLYKFKSLLIYYLQRNIIIPLFDYRKIVYRKELQYKYNIRNNDKIFNTMNKLIIEPLYKNNYVTENEIYSHELDLFSTFPRWMIFGKYIKVYNGLYVIEIFTAKKLSKITMKYKEFQIQKQDYESEYNQIASKHSRKFIKLIEMFTFNYLETITDFVSKYNNPKNDLLYFDLDLLMIINDVISLKLTEESLIKLIYKRLKLYLINNIKKGDHNHSIFLSKNENSNSRYNNTNNDNVNDNENNTSNNIENNKNEGYNDDTMSTISKSFLQIENSEIFEEMRKSLQLSSLESNDQIINTSEISDPFQNISFIKNMSNNNNDALSFLSYKMSESKKMGSGVDLISILDKKEDSLNLSKNTADKQIKAYRGKRNSIGPTFNIIVNNNTTFNLNRSNNNIFNRRVSLKSSKDNKINNFNISKKNNITNNNIFNNNNKQNIFKKRSNSFTESGLFFKQFYTLINNSKFFKNKHQILSEIQEKISSMKNNNTLRDLQTEGKLKKNSIFYKHNLKNGKENDEEIVNNLRSNENKMARNKIHLIKSYSSISIDENEKTNKVDNGGDAINEFYGDKSSLNFMQNNDNNCVLKKLNQRY